MKKQIVEITLIVIVLQIFSIISFANTTPYLYIKDVTKYQNSDEVTVEIYMENIDSNIVTLGFDLKYDTQKLEYLNSKAGKDLKASIQMAEDLPEESRVSIGALSIGGFKNNGIYYSITFKVKDSSKDIPLTLNIREVTDSKGNEIKINTKNGIIKISSEKSDLKENETKNENQKINDFEKSDINELDTIEDILIDKGNIEVSNSDTLVYETEDINVVEVLNDGIMIPNQDGKTNVKVKLNGQTIGNLEVEVKDGKVSKVSGTENKSTSNASGTNEGVNSEKDSTNLNNTAKNNNTNNELDNIIENNKDAENDKESLNRNNGNDETLAINSKGNSFTIAIIVIVIIIILFLIFLIIKNKKMGGKK